MNIARISLSIIAAICLALGVAFPAAASYPDKPIKLIVPFPPGGPTDVMARLVAQQLSAALGSVLVENRPGAGGTIGTRAVAVADPDGYTLLFGSTSTLAINPATYTDLPYDPISAFTPVGMVATSPFILVVTPSLPVKSVAELIAYAKKNPGRLNFGSAGIGTTPHLTGEMFKTLTGVPIVHVPYKGGAPVINDLLAGQIEMTFELPVVLLPLIRAGKLRPLAVTTAARSPDLPDVPTMIESGVPDLRSSSWFGVVGPARLPAPIVSKLNAAINNALASPEVSASLAKLGSHAKSGSPQEFAALIAEEVERWKAVVKTAIRKTH